MQQFLQPKNALQRATELRSVGQTEEAFETLHRTITDRKFRYMQWDATQQEEVVTQYARLAVELDRVKAVREGLLQYRNHCQHTTAQLGPLIRVLVTFRTAAEERFAKAEKAALSAHGGSLSADTASGLVVPGGGTATPPSSISLIQPEAEVAGIDEAETLMMCASQADPSTDAARDLNHQMRLVFEVYRTIMDIVKTTPKLHKVYHETAHKAFGFCRMHKKPNEFRRLCEMVRNHYQSLLKPKLKPEADAATRLDLEELRAPEVHIETRLSQLTNAAELNLWKEAMQTMEDLYSLGIIDLAGKRGGAKSRGTSGVLRQLLLVSLATYYEKLAEVFGRSGYRGLHALALLKWLGHTRQYKKVSPEELEIWASMAALAVIGVPVTRNGRGKRTPPSSSVMIYDEEKRLTTLLGHPTIPTRESLVSALRDRGLLQHGLASVQELFQIVEGQDFLSLTAVKKIEPLFKQIESDLIDRLRKLEPERATTTAAAATTAPADGSVVDGSDSIPGHIGISVEELKRRVSEYVNYMREAIFRKLIISLSGVYSTISIDYFRTKICPQSFMSWSAAEHSLVSLVDECSLHLKIDYLSGVIKLGQEETQDPHGIVNKRLATLSAALLRITAANKAAASSTSASTSSTTKMTDLKMRLAAEAQKNAARLQLLEQRRTEMEHLQKRRDEDLEELAKEKAKREAEVEQEKQRQLAEERQQMKRKEEAEAARLECARVLFKKIQNVITQIGASPSTFTLCGSTVNSLTPEALISRQINFRDFEQAVEDYQQKTRQELIRQKRAEAKRIDHYARALRMEEASHIEEWKAVVVPEDQAEIDLLKEERLQERELGLEELSIRQKQLFACDEALTAYFEKFAGAE